MVCIELLHCLRVTVVPPFPPEYESDSADCRLRKEFPETFVQFEDRKFSREPGRLQCRDIWLSDCLSWFLQSVIQDGCIGIPADAGYFFDNL